MAFSIRSAEDESPWMKRNLPQRTQPLLHHPGVSSPCCFAHSSTTYHQVFKCNELPTIYLENLPINYDAAFCTRSP
ncbi:hypothetical protein MANES_18G145241v8 [Manihot esculenta]|uniref:Uncharacterized protein n=1 Tax=Manihot esculenta TaxID=3983 RepID=A0ACB7G2W8_MANES|nr:hypothetical protein MANES_18G145241v8 [Manihot esculenta]